LKEGCGALEPCPVELEVVIPAVVVVAVAVVVAASQVGVEALTFILLY
jgi:hypothetical protein